MKKLLFLLPGLCLLASWSVAETIESVSFNPSRLGRYENLKVSDTLKTKGGINAQAVTVQSASSGTVDLNNNKNYAADQVTVKGKIDMPSTRFVSSSLESKGTAGFINKSSSASSSISTLDTEVARLKGNVLKLGSVVVTGASAQDFDGNQMSGLTLGGNKIPVADPSCKNLQWVSRVADDGNAYKVLAFGSCNGEETEECQGECGASMYKDCFFPEGNGNAWCYLYTYDKESCSYKKDSSNPSWGIRCPALDNKPMAASTCSCEASGSEGESDYIWVKQGPSFTVYNILNSWPIVSVVGAGSPSCGGDDPTGCFARINTSLARVALTPNVWNDQSVPRCSTNVKEGSACDKVADSCFVFGTYEELLAPPETKIDIYRNLFMGRHQAAWNYMLQTLGDSAGVENAINRLRVASAYGRSAQLMMCKHKNSL